MPIVVVEDPSPTSPQIVQAAHIIRNGGLVAFPTETVYGLAANALRADAISKIFAAKGRPDYNPLIVHVSDVAAAKRLVSHWDERADKLAAEFWPGPLTLVLPKSSEVPDAVTAGLKTVAIRVPAHPVAHALLEACGLPLAAPSANRSTEVSPTRAEHVLKSLGGRVDLILDGGTTNIGIESTVVDLTGEVAVLLRPGMVSLARLNEVIPVIPLKKVPEGEAARRSPGMLDRHYAPRAVLRIFDRDEEGAIRNEIESAGRIKEVTGMITYSGLDFGCDHIIQLSDDPSAYARGLYDAFHQMDDKSCDLVFLERPPATPEWDAVHDRLRRAAQ
jgi:L-threonylcarbamoyladenylate synthase